MKNLIYLCVLVLIAACTAKEPEKKEASIFVEAKVNEFVGANPDWTIDEVKEKEITEKFQQHVIKWSNEADFLKDMPLELKEVKDSLFNAQPFKIAVFKAYNDSARSKSSVLNYMQLQVDGLVSEAQIKELVIGKKYYVTGSLYKQGKRADVKFIHVADFKGYDLGRYLFLITGYKDITNAKP